MGFLIEILYINPKSFMMNNIIDFFNKYSMLTFRCSQVKWEK